MRGGECWLVLVEVINKLHITDTFTCPVTLSSVMCEAVAYPVPLDTERFDNKGLITQPGTLLEPFPTT